jgi:hypothetical protein
MLHAKQVHRATAGITQQRHAAQKGWETSAYVYLEVFLKLFRPLTTHRTIPARHKKVADGGQVGVRGLTGSSSSSWAKAAAAVAAVQAPYSCVVAQRTNIVSASSLNCLKAGSDMMS